MALEAASSSNLPEPSSLQFYFDPIDFTQIQRDQQLRQSRQRPISAMQQPSLTNLVAQISTPITRAHTHLENSDYTSAATTYSEISAILTQGLHDSLCLQSHAYQQCGQLEQALSAARRATVVKSDGLGYYWEGKVFFEMGEFGKAKTCFGKARDVGKRQGDRIGCEDWIERCVREEEKRMGEGMGDGDVGMNGEGGKKERDMNVDKNKGIKVNWYQNDGMVTLDLYVKNVVKESSTIVFQKDVVKIGLKREGGEDYVRDIHVFDKIVPEQSSWHASKFKVEIRMKKGNVGAQWKGLDQDEANQAIKEAEAKAKRIADMQKRKREGWNAVIEKEQIDKEVYGDPAMDALKKIYADADEDVRKAMMKSYSESGGKVLSTDWSDVKQRKVEYHEKK